MTQRTHAGNTRINPREIRKARIGYAEERFNETAIRIGCHPADVHRATKYAALDADEKQNIVDAFLKAERAQDVAARHGVSIACVLETVRNRLILETCERAMLEERVAA
jgi:hypothetical protein